MKFMLRDARRSQLDRQLHVVRPLLPTAPPKGGWTKAIRESLGMTLESFGRLLGLNRSGAFKLEQSEANESISIKRLRMAADALGCDLAVVLVPRRPLSEVVEMRAMELAQEKVQRINHSMALEGQNVSQRELDEMVRDLAKDLLKGGRKLWE